MYEFRKSPAPVGFITIAQVAARTGLTPRAIRASTIPFIRSPRVGTRLYRIADVDAHIKEQP